MHSDTSSHSGILSFIASLTKNGALLSPATKGGGLRRQNIVASFASLFSDKVHV